MLTVATWNVENLFRPGSGGTKLTQAGYQRKLDYLASTLAGTGADVVALQEIGGVDELGDLVKVVGDRFPYQAVGVPDARGIRWPSCRGSPSMLRWTGWRSPRAA